MKSDSLLAGILMAVVVALVIIVALQPLKSHALVLFINTPQIANAGAKPIHANDATTTPYMRVNKLKSEIAALQAELVRSQMK